MVFSRIKEVIAKQFHSTEITVCTKIIYKNTGMIYWMLLSNGTNTVTENQTNGLHALLLELFILQLKWTKLYSDQFGYDSVSEFSLNDYA